MRKLIDTRFGPMMVNDQDVYIGRSLIKYGEFSPGETAVFQQLIQPSMTIVDVGANIGAHTIAFAKMTGPEGLVYAFEPQRLVFQMLCANVALNHLNNVFCQQQAVGTPGWVGMASPDPNAENNFGGMGLADLKGNEPVEVVRLETPCHFLKIDVEGMEREVLEGSADMIRKSLPILYVENDRLEKSHALIDCVYDLGYVPYWHITELYSPDNWAHNPENVFGPVCSMNMLCLPPAVTVEGLDRVERGTTYREYLTAKQAALAA